MSCQALHGLHRFPYFISYLQRSHFFYFAYPESRERSLGYTTQRMPDSISVHMIAASAAQWGERRIAPAGGESPGSSRAPRDRYLLPAEMACGQ